MPIDFADDLTTWDTDRLIDEWTALFREHRDRGFLPDVDRILFRAMSAEMRRRGLLTPAEKGA